MEHRWPQIDTTSPIVLEATIFETQKQLVGVKVIQSLDSGITNIGVETVIVPNMDVIKKGVLIGFVAKWVVESQ